MSFTPLQIPDCEIWLDATDSSTLTTSGGNVSVWADKSGNGNNFSQADPNRYPNLNPTGINNLNTLYFTGPASGGNVTSLFLENATVVIGSNYTVFSVAKQDAIAPSLYNYNYLIKGSLTVDTVLLYGSGDTAFGQGNPGNFIVSTGDGAGTWNDLVANNPNYPTKNPFVGSVVINGTSVNPFYNGSNQDVKVGTYYTTTFTGMSLGEPQPNTFSGQNWNGLAGEIIIYNRNLEVIERQQVEGYLAWKWGLQSDLPSTHPYFNGPPLGIVGQSPISTSTELVFLNTSLNAGTLILPSTNIIGRILTFKDIQGTFGVRGVTFTTQLPEQVFETNSSNLTVNNPFGSYSFMTGPDSRWYTVGGSYMNSASISSINALSMNVLTVSTANVTVSSLVFEDTSTNSTNNLYLQSTLLQYSSPIASFVVGGSRAPKNLYLRPLRSFLPSQIPGLAYWYDASDPNVIQASGTLLTRILNKGLSNQFPLNRASNSPRIGFQTPNGLSCVRLAVNDVVVYQGDYSLGNSRTHMIVSRPLVNTTTGGARFIWENAADLSTREYFSFESGRLNELTQGLQFTIQSSDTGLNLSNQLSMFTFRTFEGTNASNAGNLNGSNLTLEQTNSPAYFNVSIPYYMNVDSPFPIGSQQDFCEFLSWNSCLSLSQFQQVEGYLAWKWGIVSLLPPNHPFKTTPP